MTPRHGNVADTQMSPDDHDDDDNDDHDADTQMSHDDHDNDDDDNDDHDPHTHVSPLSRVSDTLPPTHVLLHVM